MAEIVGAPKLGVVVPVFNEPEIDVTLSALYNQDLRNPDLVHHFVVDNGSTDNTREVIGRFSDAHEDFPLTIVEEEQKGTGAASDTGATSAIGAGFQVVARTDGDSAPASSWTETIYQKFQRKADIQLAGGRSRPLRDEYYRTGDEFLMPVAVVGARIALALKHLNRDYLRAAVGHNMATRSSAYERVGGFSRVSIGEMDEDIEYSLKIANEYGRGAIDIDPRMVVATSMRRIREYGIIGTSLHHLFPELRKRYRKEIDVR